MPAFGRQKSKRKVRTKPDPRRLEQVSALLLINVADVEKEDVRKQNEAGSAPLHDASKQDEASARP